MRTLQQALDRAKTLRDFKSASPDRFEKCNDFEDLVTLADEVERFSSQNLFVIETAPPICVRCTDAIKGGERFIRDVDGIYHKHCYDLTLSDSKC